MSVPSFASFPDTPPTFNSFPDLDDGSQAGPSNLEASSKKDRTHKKKKDKGKHKERDRSKAKSPTASSSTRHHRHLARSPSFSDLPYDEHVKAEEDRLAAANTTEDILQEDPPTFAPADNHWFLDKSGDADNVRYGQPNRKSTPKYYRGGCLSFCCLKVACNPYHHTFAAGRLVGTSSEWRIQRSGDKLDVSNSRGRKTIRISDKAFLRELNKSNDRPLLKPNASHRMEDPDAEFISLPRKGLSSSQSGFDRSKLLDAGGNEEDMATDDSDKETPSESSSEEETMGLTAEQARIKEIEGALSRDPSSVSNWLALIRHSLESVPITSTNAAIARADIALAILKRAMNSHPSMASSVTLRLAYLSYQEDMSNPSSLNADWTAAVRELRNPEITLEWLNWRIRSGKDRGISAFAEDAEKCMGMMLDDFSRVLGLWRIAVSLIDAGNYMLLVELYAADATLHRLPRTCNGLDASSV